MRLPSAALAASLLLNLFFVGALAGGALVFGTKTGIILPRSLRIEGAALSRADVSALRAALQEIRRSLRDTTADRRAALAEAARLLRAQDLDQTALSNALGRARADDATIREAVEARAVSFMAMLPADARGRVAAAMQARAARHPGP